MNEQEAFFLIVNYLNQMNPESEEVSLNKVFREHKNITSGATEDDPDYKKFQPYFQDAAWQLCKMGVLLPWFRSSKNTKSTEAGIDFTITERGRNWVNQKDDFIYKSPSHFSELLSSYDALFGEGYKQRSQEACSTYLASCYLATCVMCGAAAESILLKTAIAANPKEEKKILEAYESSGGTRNVLNKVKSKFDEPHKQAQLEQLNHLINYRRNASAHGQFIEVAEFDAYDSLSRLIRFAIFIKDHWEKIVRIDNQTELHDD